MSLATPEASARGRVTVLGFRLFYETFGRPERGTVLCLHGGPGVPHGYLTCLSDLAGFGYRVVLYDQLGCGKSDRPKGTSLFTIERAVEEADGIRRAFHLGRIHLLGNSYGGMLALAYAIKYSRNLRSLVVSSGLASVPLANAELRRLVAAMPADTRRTIDRLERREAFDHPDYQRAAQHPARDPGFEARNLPAQLAPPDVGGTGAVHAGRRWLPPDPRWTEVTPRRAGTGRRASRPTAGFPAHDSRR